MQVLTNDLWNWNMKVEKEARLNYLAQNQISTKAQTSRRSVPLKSHFWLCCLKQLSSRRASLLQRQPWTQARTCRHTEDSLSQKVSSERKSTRNCGNTEHFTDEQHVGSTSQSLNTRWRAWSLQTSQCQPLQALQQVILCFCTQCCYSKIKPHSWLTETFFRNWK